MMAGKKRIFSLVAILTVVSIVIVGSTVAILYNFALEYHQVRLTHNVKNQVSLIRAVAKYNQKTASDLLDENPEFDVFEATLSQLREAHFIFEGLGELGEFNLARLEEDQIVYLLNHREHNSSALHPVPVASTIAEPMRLALKGESGVIEGLDYRGEQVLAAYGWVAELKFGVVAKIDLSEIRAPFIRAGLISAGIALLLILIGTLLFFRIGNPMVSELFEQQNKLKDITSTMPGCVYQFILHKDRSISFTHVSEAFEGITGIKTQVITGDATTFRDIVHSDDQRSFWKSIKRSARTMTCWENEFRVVAPDKSITWLCGKSNPKLLPDGSIIWNGVLIDITKRKKAELEIEHAAAFAQFNPAPVLRTDLKGVITLINPAAKSMFERDVTGEQIESIMSSTVAFVDDPAIDIKPGHFEQELKDEIYSFSILRNKSTHSIYVYGSNITRRKRIENALAASEEQFRAISSSANDAIVMINDNGDITYWNNAAEKIFGVPSNEILGEHFHDLFVPERFQKQHKEAFINFLITGEGDVLGKTIEVEAKRRDGTEFPIDLSLSGVKLNGKWHAVGIIRDITERKNNENKLRKLSFAIEQSANTVVITDTNGVIEYVNPKFTESTGFTSEEAIGKNPSILKSGDKTSETYKNLWETISSGGSWKGEFQNKNKSGELYWEKATISPIIDESGSIISYLAIKEDITRQKELETEREMLQIEMNQSSKLEAVGSLAAGIAHEINTPIQFVGDNTNFLADSFKTLMSLLESYEGLWQKANVGDNSVNLDSEKTKAKESADLDYLKEEIPTAIEQALEGVQRVTKIVGAMKNFAHSDQGEKSIGNINEMLESTLTVALNELKYVANLEMEFCHDLPNIECYRDDLNQVFLNLLVNAAHTIADVVGDASTGKGTITVSTHMENDNVVIKISDTGKGIPQSIQDRVFDPFFSTKDVGKGSGQGLSIARKTVVDKHGGRLDFETEEGKGTTFIIRLPIHLHEETASVT